MYELHVTFLPVTSHVVFVGRLYLMGNDRMDAGLGNVRHASATVVTFE